MGYERFVYKKWAEKPWGWPMIAPYPLQWPDNRSRIPASRRIRSPFRTAYDKAVENVATSLRGFQKDAGVKIEHVILSSNVSLLDRSPSDPGAAAWFMMDGQWVAFGVDRFGDVAANVQAIHHIVEARRVELRYGGLEIVRQTFKAFIALPAPATRSWRTVLDLGRSPSRSDVEAAYRAKAKAAHPDAGGSHVEMANLNRARDEALREIGQ